LRRKIYHLREKWHSCLNARLKINESAIHPALKYLACLYICIRKIVLHKYKYNAEPLFIFALIAPNDIFSTPLSALAGVEDLKTEFQNGLLKVVMMNLGTAFYTTILGLIMNAICNGVMSVFVFQHKQVLAERR
jgi:hypothetical protein